MATIREKIVEEALDLEWRAIPSWPYEVSHNGIVRRTEGGAWCTKGKILKHIIDSKGYHRVKLCCNGNQVTFKVYRLVCWLFNGDPEGLRTQVRHLDGDPDNNDYRNLKWGTCKENMADRTKHGRRIYDSGEENHNSTYSKRQVLLARKLWDSGIYTNKAAIGRLLAMHPISVRDIVERRTWKHV